MELKRVFPILLSAVVVLLSACGDDVGLAGACVKASCVKTLDLSAPSPRLLKNGTLQLEASPFDASGAAVPPAVVSWRSTNSGIANVDANGLVTGVELGSTAITASAGGVERSFTVQVVNRPSSCAAPGTVASAPTTEPTLWRTADGPYHVDAEVAIGVTLSVEPGTLICGGPNGALNVDSLGSILAVGSAGDTIVFTATYPAQPWGGITGGYPRAVVLKFVRFENARRGLGVINARPDPAVMNGNLTIEDSRFSQISGGAIVVSQGGAPTPMTVTRTIIENAGAGVSFTLSGRLELRQVTVRNVRSIGIEVGRATLSLRDVTIDNVDGTGLWLQFPGGLQPATNVVITRSGTGIASNAIGVTLTGFTFVNNRGDGVVINNIGTDPTVAIHGCNFSGNGGVAVRNNSSFGTIDASLNWWGDPAGPNGASGDGIAGNVSFTPVLTQPVPNPNGALTSRRY